MGTLRRLALPHKKLLKRLNLLTSQKADLRKPPIATSLIEAYKRSKNLYLPFKRRSKLDLASFIELMQDFGDQLRQYGHVHPGRSSPKPKNILILPEAMRRLMKAYRTAQGSSHFTIDAFRNPYEVEYFKRRYSEFYLVSIQRSINDCHSALQGLSKESLQKLEERERGKRFPKRRENIHQWVTSQNINECSQKADFYIPYSGKVLTKPPVLKAFRMMPIICSLINDAYVRRKILKNS